MKQSEAIKTLEEMLEALIEMQMDKNLSLIEKEALEAGDKIIAAIEKLKNS